MTGTLITPRALSTLGLGLALLGCGTGGGSAPTATPETPTAPGVDAPAGELVAAVPADLPLVEAGQVDLHAGARAANAFGWDLHQKLSKSGANLIWSPYSVASSMGMALAGAKGGTATEMQQAMHAPAGGAAALAQALGVHQRLLNERAGEGNTIRIGNAVFGAAHAQFVPGFIDTVGAAYGGGLYRLDFGNPEAARGAINGWVSEQTEARIPDLIPPGLLTPTTQAVLCNALYFKGTWASKFSESATKPGAFHRADGTDVEHPMMHRRSDLQLVAVPDATVAAFPYGGNTLSMVIVLPARRAGLSALEQRLTGDTLTEWVGRALKAGKTGDVKITLPKWKARVASMLKTPLQEMGLRVCFDPQAADFSGMISGDRVWIDDVVHQAMIEVSEEGTVAAAATATVMKGRGGPPPEVTRFSADHPFLYAIVEHETQAILFLGRCADPSKE